MSGWWFAAGCVGLFLTLWAFASRRWKRQALILTARRPNPTHEQFIALLVEDCDHDIAEFVWRIFTEDYSGWGVELTPHPDDDYLRDLPIDPENQGDWLDEFRESFALSHGNFPRWPDGAQTTVRKFARWLSDGRRSSIIAAA